MIIIFIFFVMRNLFLNYQIPRSSTNQGMSTRLHGLFCAFLTYLARFLIHKIRKQQKKKDLHLFRNQSQTIWSRALFGLITVHHSECLIADLVAAQVAL